ncbi:hypothetical protein BaRGS_00036876 [Batillaria attramentaria]|uniref:NAD(P)-binding domain-containing protein n=1 Tax=Batillaria attramentaria TaxID=370345 RepID=A0ABD0JAK1_9CAEN
MYTSTFVSADLRSGSFGAGSGTDTAKRNSMSVQKVDLSKEEDLAAAIKGVDAVMSCLGFGQNRGMCTPCTLYTDTIVVVTNAMRLVCISAWGSKGKEVRTCESQLVQNAAYLMSRGDVAKFMLMSLATDKYDRKTGGND